jgi:hypothetical protein
MSYKVLKYNPGMKQAWNDFVRNAKNSTFLFERAFMDYHSDRFIDYSLVIWKGDEICALLPANYSEGIVHSHQGLSYGGFVFRNDIRLIESAHCIFKTLQFLHLENIQELRLKIVPDFYSISPVDDVKYIFWLLNAVLYRVDTALVVKKNQQLPLQERRKRSIKKSGNYKTEIKSGCEVEFIEFWNNILEPNLLERYNVRPVHSLSEIIKLHLSFPDNIVQYNIYCNNQIVAGTTLFLNKHVTHAQYISGSSEGRSQGHLDSLFDFVMKETFASREIFDFGICNEDGGKKLNMGLLDWKEGFGGRTCVHNFYSIQTSSMLNLSSMINVNE